MTVKKNKTKYFALTAISLPQKIILIIIQAELMRFHSGIFFFKEKRKERKKKKVKLKIHIFSLNTSLLCGLYRNKFN